MKKTFSIISLGCPRNLVDSESIVSEFKKRGFKEEELLMLPKVKFWESPKSISQQIVFSLFSELVNFWLPEGDLKRILDNILIEKIYEGSEKGQVYYKTDILSEIDNLQKATVKKSGHFDRERISTEAQLDNIIVAIENDRSPLWAENQLSAISARPNLMYFILDKFKNKKIDNLEEWKDLWQLNRIYGYSFNISRIFENNCHTEGNRRYVLNFIKETIPNVRRFYRNDYFYTDSVRIIKKIVDCDRSFLNEAFEIVKILLSSYENDYFYLKKDHSLDYEKAEVCKVLSWIFRNAKSILREKIYQFTSSYFNLIEDQGEYSHYTPLDIFNILHEHLISDSNKFEDRFVKLSEELSEQYSRFYKSRFGRKERFTGWELMGGMTSFWGGEYKISDRHFVGYILAPALSNYYQRNRHKAWKFILKDCITKENSVSKEQPDFLNRAAFIVVLNRFKSNNKEVANAAFRILKEFVLSRKGIPHKSELIYQEVSSNAPNNKKWRLVSLSIKKFKVPTSPFVEQIVSDLARDGHTKSKYILRQWSKNPDYYKKTKFLGNDLIGHITSLLSNSFEDAIEMFENYINGDYFINNLDSFDVYKVAGLLNGILKKDFTLGLNILNGLKCKENLSKINKFYYVLACLDLMIKIQMNANGIKEFMKNLLMYF